MKTKKICKGCGKEFTPVAAFSEMDVCRTGCGTKLADVQRLEVEIDPVAKPRMTRSDKWNTRTVVMKYWKFKDDIKRAAAESNFVLSLHYEIYFFIQMPASWSKKKKLLMNKLPHDTKPDLDNLVKSINDSLKDEDDSKIWHINAYKFWSDKPVIIIKNL